METPNRSFADRFRAYFERDVAIRAAEPLSGGATIGFTITTAGGETLEQFAFKRAGKADSSQAVIEPGPAPSPEVTFTLMPSAADAILDDPSEDIGTIGVNILKLVVSGDANRRVSLKVHAGFLTLFSKGYFGVLKNGGTGIANFLAARGLGGMGAIKSALKNLRN